MDRDRALWELPAAYATALRLHAAGARRELIATALGIDVDGVESLLVLAEAKLHRVLAGADLGLDHLPRADGDGR